MSADPGEPVALNVSCIAGGCGFATQNDVLFFDSSNFSLPQTVLLTDTAFNGKNGSVFQIVRNEFVLVSLTVIRDYAGGAAPRAPLSRPELD